MASLDVLGGIASGVAYKAPCAVATIADMTGALIGLPVIDGYQIQAGDRVLVWKNADQSTNGIYTAALSAWTRSIDFCSTSAVTKGTQVLVNNGTAHSGFIFELTTANVTFGSSAISFAVIGGNATIVQAGYQGALAVDPTVDLAGNPLTSTAWYYNTVLARTKSYVGGVWVVSIAAVYETSGIPSNSVGANGDIAIDPVLGNLYSKSGGVWALTLSIGANSPSTAMLPVVQAASIPAGYAAIGGAIIKAPCRLTLTSGVPVLSAANLSASSLIITPFEGNQAPLWNGTGWGMGSFLETSALLSDTTNSPGACVAGAVYDWFFFWKSGTWVLGHGPAWTNALTRSAGTALTRVNGFLTNSVSITNGPAAGYGLYVGTTGCDLGAATLSFNPNPAAASGGPSGGAWVGLWNAFNRVSVSATAQDNKTSWTYSSGAWRQSDNSANNRITNVVGQVQDSISAVFVQGETGAQGSYSMVGIGVNSASTPSGVVGITPNTDNSGGSSEGSPTARFDGLPSLGLSFYQALEWSNSTSSTFYGGSTPSGVSAQAHQLSALFTY